MLDYDSTERSLGLKVLLGTHPVVQRQTVRHPSSYPKAAPAETMAHFQEFPIDNARPKQAPRIGRVGEWMWDYVAKC
ncbi:hypothetical protein H4R18_003728 [Coemansia javaensis]|uniref:Uncharacterized protein n=1 Tax=Coemansia javaensis TaxID=2761396 RepID=A0A9W8HEC4_9FUNG|nr:hypothetical protein H4R18_003728 [Coemansia javaensis]